MPSFITLTTDFGLRDPFVASMKGVILSINPQVHLIDLSHDIAPQDIREAAFTLRSTYRYFPKGTIHVAVVDPGVGSGRRPVIVTTESYFFVGPDNGLFSPICQEAERLRVHQVTADRYFLPNPGPTFHGRDIFAPVAAWLTKGVPSADFGKEISDYVKMDIPLPEKEPDGIRGQVIHFDRFGNAITNIMYSDIKAFLPKDDDPKNLLITVPGREIRGLKRFYAEASAEELGGIINSSGHLELFLYKQNARTAFSFTRGDGVRITLRPS